MEPSLSSFTSDYAEIGSQRIFFRHAGEGRPIILLHGYPQTHLCWHSVAPKLAEEFHVVVPDLRGYGRSKCDYDGSDPSRFAKRELAKDVVGLMSILGHSSFACVGHDRGARVAYRAALDFPAQVNALVLLDIIPTLDMWERMNQHGAMGAFHWLLLAQPYPLPETLIGKSSAYWTDHLLRKWAGEDFEFPSDAKADYIGQFEDAEILKASCDDYRAGHGLDRFHDAGDMDCGRTISCPTKIISGSQFMRQSANDIRQIWSRWCSDLDVVQFSCGHFIAEERPEACLREIRSHLHSNEGADQ